MDACGPASTAGCESRGSIVHKLVDRGPKVKGGGGDVQDVRMRTVATSAISRPSFTAFLRRLP